jgi:FAD/FMN-containing dehydrogenase
LLGGGYGYLARPYGLACDSLLSAALVNPDGKQVRADAHQNTDLYWACRGGGGGSFGIATSFTVRLKKVANVIVFKVVWSGLSTKAATGVMKAWQAGRRRRHGQSIPIWLQSKVQTAPSTCAPPANRLVRSRNCNVS